MPKKSGPNKSDFVRSQPSTLSASEVVAKGKEAGLKFSPALVYVIRAKKKGQAAKAPKTKKAKVAPATVHAPAAAPAHVKEAGDKLSASDFIRSLPNTLSVKEVAKKAAAEGYSFKPAYVYDVRNADKKRKAKAAKLARTESKAAPAASHKPVAAPKPAAAHGHSSSQRAQFRKLMIDLGLTQAEALYADVCSELKAIRDRE